MRFARARFVNSLDTFGRGARVRRDRVTAPEGCPASVAAFLFFDRCSFASGVTSRVGVRLAFRRRPWFVLNPESLAPGVAVFAFRWAAPLRAGGSSFSFRRSSRRIIPD